MKVVKTKKTSFAKNLSGLHFSSKMKKLEKLSSMEGLYSKKNYQKNTEDFEDSEEGSLDVYAELSKRQFDLVKTGEYSIEIPYGVSMVNHKGSKALHFICSDKEAAQELIDGLDSSGIVWQ